MADERIWTTHDERRISVVAACDPRSVRRYLRGELRRATVAQRIERAMRELGYAAVPPSEVRRAG